MPDLEIFRSEVAAIAYLEHIRWPNVITCPRCGSTSTGSLNGNATKVGTRKCYSMFCRRTFSVRTGTRFNDTHVPLHKWLQLIALYVCNSDMKDADAARIIDVTYATIPKMLARLRQ